MAGPKLPLAKREEAVQAYMEAQSILYVSRKTGIAKKTAERWYAKDKGTKFDWDKRVEQVRLRTQALVNETEAQRRDRHLRFLRRVQDKGIDALEADELKPTLSDVLNAIDHEREIHEERPGQERLDLPALLRALSGGDLELLGFALRRRFKGAPGDGGNGGSPEDINRGGEGGHQRLLRGPVEGPGDG